jgi:hypothetical protein
LHLPSSRPIGALDSKAIFLSASRFIMLRLSLIAVALSTLSFAAAQSQNFTINVGSIPDATKATWCQAELNTCGTLCGQTNIGENACTVSTLAYNCTCADNTTPPLEEYLQSMPYFICQQAFADCNTANVGNANGQAKCKTDIQDKCGSKTPAEIQASATTTSASPSNTGMAASSSSAGPSSTVQTSATSTGAAAATNLAYFGNGAAVVAAGLFAALL